MRRRVPIGLALPSPGLVVSLLALVLSISGTAMAIQANSVRSQHIVDGQVKMSDVGTGAVKSAKLADGAVARGKLATGAVRGAAIAPDGVSAPKLAEGGLTGADFELGVIDHTQLAPNAVNTAALADSAVTAANVPLNALVSAHLGNLSITGSAIAANAVTSAKVGANSLTGSDINENTLTSPLVRNVSRHTVQSPSNTNIAKEATVTCPAGKTILGGGGAIPAIGHITASYPEATTRWRVVGARYEGSSTTSWSLTAFAICAQI